VKITEQMDNHDVGHGRGGIEAALGGIGCRMMVMGIDSDLLYPLHEQELLAAHIPNCDFRVVTSVDGHDGFLLEQDQVATNIVSFLAADTKSRL
jgi:homoserine O-acetyltransferase